MASMYFQIIPLLTNCELGSSRLATMHFHNCKTAITATSTPPTAPTLDPLSLVLPAVDTAASVTVEDGVRFAALEVIGVSELCSIVELGGDVAGDAVDALGAVVWVDVV
jgi:hypothetical protein